MSGYQLSVISCRRGGFSQQIHRLKPSSSFKTAYTVIREQGAGSSFGF
ncbi:hypothetical protein [Chroococcidiopsis sp.]